MSNPNFNANTSGNRGRAKSPPATGKRGGNTAMNEKTASWGGLPGKSQSKRRNAGVPAIKQHPKSDGI